MYTCNVFFGVTERCFCNCSEDLQTGFGFSVDVVRVLLESHSFVIGHSKCCEGVGVGYGCVVECDSGLCCHWSLLSVLRVWV